MSRDPVEREIVTGRVVGPGFHERVYDVVRRVPEGRVTTYGDVATMLGSPRVARHVGWALAALRDVATSVPWHRVVNGRGRISHRGDLWRSEDQYLRLAAEGVPFDAAGRIEDFADRRCPPSLLAPPASG